MKNEHYFSEKQESVFRINSIDTTDENIKKVCKNINMDKSPFFF